MIRLVLASGSPRRKALLAALGLAFDVVPSQAEELLQGEPADLVVMNARAKRDEVAARLTYPAVIIGADTLVFLDGDVLGKPRDLVEAQAILERLSGKEHRVLTGLSLADTATGKTAEGWEATVVTFRSLTPSEIGRFVEAVQPVDRAGAYTVEGPGSLLVESYRGCYQNVLGLPIVRLDKLMREIGHSLFDLMKAEQSLFL